MSQFPKNRADILDLAQKVLNGFGGHPDVYPNPPIDLEAFRHLIQNNYALIDQMVSLQAALAEVAAQLEHSTEVISEQTKTAIRYAENTTQNEQELAFIGWGQRAEPTPQAAPGQTRNLEIVSHGEGTVELQWKSPSDGGKPAFYKIYRRELPDGEWVLVDSIAAKTIILTNQPRGKSLEYRVVANNKTGSGPESNTVVVVL